MQNNDLVAALARADDYGTIEGVSFDGALDEADLDWSKYAVVDVLYGREEAIDVLALESRIRADTPLSTKALAGLFTSPSQPTETETLEHAPSTAPTHARPGVVSPSAGGCSIGGQGWVSRAPRGLRREGEEPGGNHRVGPWVPVIPVIPVKVVPSETGGDRAEGGPRQAIPPKNFRW